MRATTARFRYAGWARWLAVAAALWLPLGVWRGAASADELDALMQQVEKESSTGKASGARSAELMAGIASGPADERRAALWECRIYVDNPAMVKQIGEMVLKEKPDIASMAALVLGQMKTKPATEWLVGGLASKSSYVRECVAYALGVAGDASAVGAIEKAMPEQPGLSRWIYEDAIAAIKSGSSGKPAEPGAPVHRASAPPARRPAGLDETTLFYIGGRSVDNLSDLWSDMLARRKFKFRSIPATDLNPQMNAFGGPLNASAFFAALADKDGRPQVDVAFVSSMMPDEFPYELQWRLMQFARRGGTVVMLGSSFYLNGRVTAERGKLVRTYRHIPDVWDSCVPKADGEFRPIVAGSKRPLVMMSGVKAVGHGKVLALRSNDGGHAGDSPRGWEEHYVGVPQVEHILDFALRGDDAFPALADIASAPSRFEAGKPLPLSLTLYAGKPAPGELTCELMRGDATLATMRQPVDPKGQRVTRLTAKLPTDWWIADGATTVRVTYAVGGASHTASADVDAESPMRLDWTIDDAYDAAGVPDEGLRGTARIDSRWPETVGNVTLFLEVFTPDGKVMQRQKWPLTIKPGRSEPVGLRLAPRDYPTGSYPMALRIEFSGRTAQSSSRMLFRNSRFNFDQDLILAPFGGLAPDEDRARKLMVESGFNAVGVGRGSVPGWYSWGYGIAPVPKYQAMWPGDEAEELGRGWFGETGRNLRYRNPGWNIVNHWDESDTDTVISERGDISGEVSVYYRHVMQLKYKTIAALNEAWRGKTVVRDTSGKAIPPAGPWRGDLTSWNQVWGWRGPPQDWDPFASNGWWMLQGAGREEFHRFNRFHDLWHWTDVAHTRISPSEAPGTLAWQLHNGHAGWGERPASVMYHVHDGRKGEPIYRRFPWNAIAGGARHFSLWLPSLAQSGAFGWNPSWTIWNSDYTMKDWWKPAAAEMHRIRERQQIFLDAWNSHHPGVALLYHPRIEPPRALFDALHFAGIEPDALEPGTLRGERFDLSQLKVIIRLGNTELPETWKKKLDEWKAAGGTLLNASDLPFADYGPKKVTADVGVEYWLGSDQTRLLTARFMQYQAGLLATLAKAGVRPFAQVLDDAGAPAPHVEPIILTTHDGSQRYLLTIADADYFGSLASGAAADQSPATIDNPNKTPPILDATAGLNEGVKYTGAGKVRPRPWLLVAGEAPVEIRVSVDGKPPVPFRTLDAVDWFRVERGSGLRWVAGPAVAGSEGEHTIKIESNPAGAVKRVVLTDSSVLRPTLQVNDTAVKSVYDSYADRVLAPQKGGYRLTMPQSQGQVYSLITEDLGPLKADARLIRYETDRVLRVHIQATRADGSLSDCRHSVVVTARGADGKPVAAMAYGIYGDLPGNAAARGVSVRGARTVDLFPNESDPPLPWTVRVKDLTSGRSAEVTVAEAVRPDVLASAPAFDRPGEAPPPIGVETDDFTMALDGHIHLVPLRVHIANNTDKPLRGTAKVEMPADLLLDGEVEKQVDLAPGKRQTVVFAALLGRSQAQYRGMLQSPPRVWFTTAQGVKIERTITSMWIRQNEKKPPFVTDMATSPVDLAIYNFLDRPVELRVESTKPATWRVTRDLPASVAVPAGSVEKPAVVSVGFEAVVEPGAPQQPEIAVLKLSVTTGGKTFNAGIRFAQTEKHRTWFFSNRLPMEGLEGGAGKMPIPEKAVDPAKERLWGMEWKPMESDSLIDLPCEIGKTAYAVTRVRFARAGAVSARVRSDEKVKVWLAGRAMMTSEGGAPAKSEKPVRRSGDDIELDDQLGALTLDSQIKVPANEWLPVVVKYERQTPYPLTDLIFIDETGAPIWDAGFRATGD